MAGKRNGIVWLSGWMDADVPLAGHATVRCIEHRWEHDPNHYTSPTRSLDVTSGMYISKYTRW